MIGLFVMLILARNITEFAEWPDVVNGELAFTLLVLLAAMLAGVTVALACRSCLLDPVRATKTTDASPPTRMIGSANCLAVTSALAGSAAIRLPTRYRNITRALFRLLTALCAGHKDCFFALIDDPVVAPKIIRFPTTATYLAAEMLVVFMGHRVGTIIDTAAIVARNSLSEIYSVFPYSWIFTLIFDSAGIATKKIIAHLRSMPGAHERLFALRARHFYPALVGRVVHALWHVLSRPCTETISVTKMLFEVLCPTWQDREFRVAVGAGDSYSLSPGAPRSLPFESALMPAKCANRVLDLAWRTFNHDAALHAGFLQASFFRLRGAIGGAILAGLLAIRKVAVTVSADMTVRLRHKKSPVNVDRAAYRRRADTDRRVLTVSNCSLLVNFARAFDAIIIARMGY